MSRRSMPARSTPPRRSTSPYEREPVPGAEGDLLHWLPPDVRDAFRKAARPRRFAPGEIVFQHGDAGRHMYRVIEGSVRLSLMRIDGHQMIFALLGPGECVAASSLIDGQPFPQTAEALNDVQVQIVSAAAFADLRKDHRAFDDALLHLFSCRLRALSALVAAGKLADLTSQVVLRLLEVAKPDVEGRLVATVTHFDLAMFVGVSRQSIHRTVKALAAEGMIALHYGSIELLDLEALKSKADFL